MTVIDFLFPKLRPAKTWTDKCLKSPVSEDPSTSNMVNLPKQCWNLHDSIFIKFIDQCQVNWVGRSLFFTCQILGLLVNILTADEKYRVLIGDNLTIPIQMELSQKQKAFSQFLGAFLKSRLNFKYFEIKITLIDFVFPKLLKSEKRRQINV